MIIKKENPIIELIKGDITKLDVNCIVNAANKELRGGSGVCGAIFRASGSYEELQKECYSKASIKTGEAAITKGYNLKAKYIIHAVGPIYSYDDINDSKLLYNAYYNSLKLAEEYSIKSIAFPSISTGVYNYPINKASKIALKAINEFNYKTIEKVIIVCFDDETYNEYMKNAQD